MRENIYQSIEDLIAAPYGSRIRINNRYILIKDHRTISNKPYKLTGADAPVLILTFRTPSGQTVFRYIPIMKKSVLDLCKELAENIWDIYIKFAQAQYEMILDNHTFKIEKELDFNVLEL